MSLFSIRYHRPGTAPGTLFEQPSPTPAAPPARLRLVHYGPDGVHFSERRERLPSAPDATGPDTVTWLHVQGHCQNDLLLQIGQQYRLHPLALEDVQSIAHRPKVDDFEHQGFVVLALPVHTDGALVMHQVSLFFDRNSVLSFCSGALDPFAPVLRRLREGAMKFRHLGADYLLYALVDAVIDQGFPVLEALGLELEALEADILQHPEPQSLARLHQLKRQLILLRRRLWPQREVINALMRDEREWIGAETQVYLRDCYDHCVQIMDLLESAREMSASMLELYLSTLSNRTNDIMRVLTLIATIFMPLTFIVGVYGMNFEDSASPWAMPELHWYYGYPLVWLVMILLALGMLLYFRRKRWL